MRAPIRERPYSADPSAVDMGSSMAPAASPLVCLDAVLVWAGTIDDFIVFRGTRPYTYMHKVLFDYNFILTP